MIQYVAFNMEGDGLGSFDTLEEVIDMIKEDIHYDPSIEASDYSIDMREVKDDDSPSILLASFKFDYVDGLSK